MSISHKTYFEFSLKIHFSTFDFSLLFTLSWQKSKTNLVVTGCRGWLPCRWRQCGRRRGDDGGILEVNPLRCFSMLGDAPQTHGSCWFLLSFYWHILQMFQSRSTGVLKQHQIRRIYTVCFEALPKREPRALWGFPSVFQTGNVTRRP